MSTIGHGLDLVEVEHFRRLCDDRSSGALARYFTPAELRHAGTGPHRAEHLAGRFAAKEAVLKALGIGLIDGVALTDVEIVALPSGAPEIVLHAKCSEIAAERGITSWLVSISHSSTIAMASVIALSAVREARPGKEISDQGS